MVNTLGYPPGSVGYNMEGAKAVVNAKGGELTPLAKMYDSKGYTLPPTSTPEPTIGSALGTGGFDRNAALNTLNQTEAQLKALQQQKDAFYGSQADTAGVAGGIPALDLGPSMEDIYGPEIDDRAEQRRIMKMFQGEIDATNMVYDQLLNEARMEGQGRLGSQRAIAARGGILGSDFAGSQKQKVQDFNTDIYRSIGAERAAAIAAIEGKGRQYAAQEIAAKRAARQQGAENYISFLANKDARVDNWIANVAQSVINQGGTYEDVREAVEAEAEQAGIDPIRVRNAFLALQSQQQAAAAESDLKTRKTEAEIRKIEADIQEGKIKTIGEGTMLYNTETGEYFKNPKTYKPDSASGLTVGGQTLNQAAVADVHTNLQESRGDDNYANTDTYLREFEGFVNMGGDPKDFIKEYDPDVYINPNDPTRSFLQQFMRKTDQPDVFLGGLDTSLIQTALNEAATGE